MAPEQVQGLPADARTDIFALGTLLYEMATGRRAFEATTQASLIAKILETEPPPCRRCAPLAPPVVRPRRPGLPREGACRSVADGSRREAAAAMDSGAGLRRSSRLARGTVARQQQSVGAVGGGRRSCPPRSPRRGCCCWQRSPAAPAPPVRFDLTAAIRHAARHPVVRSRRDLPGRTAIRVHGDGGRPPATGDARHGLHRSWSFSLERTARSIRSGLPTASRSRFSLDSPAHSRRFPSLEDGRECWPMRDKPHRDERDVGDPA